MSRVLTPEQMLFSLAFMGGGDSTVSQANDAIKKMKEVGISVADLRNQHGETLIHLAAFYENNNLIRLFAEAGVPLDAKSVEGRTAIHSAAAGGNHEAIRILAQLGANLWDLEARSPANLVLHFDMINSVLASKDAAEKAESAAKYATTMQTLIEFGVDVDDVLGGSAHVDLAVRSGNAQMVNILLANGSKFSLPEREVKVSPAIAAILENNLKSKAVIFDDKKSRYIEPALLFVIRGFNEDNWHQPKTISLGEVETQLNANGILALSHNVSRLAGLASRGETLLEYAQKNGLAELAKALERLKMLVDTRKKVAKEPFLKRSSDKIVAKTAPVVVETDAIVGLEDIEFDLSGAPASGAGNPTASAFGGGRGGGVSHP